MVRRIRIRWMLLGLGFLLVGCRQTSPADFVVLNGPEPQSIDPQRATGLVDQRVAIELFEGLTRRNPATALAEPGLATHWELSQDGRSYTFHLRQNARWSTGESIGAADVVWSWQHAVNPASAFSYASQFYYLVNGEAINRSPGQPDLSTLGVRAIDERTLRVDLIQPTPFFPELCAAPALAVVPRWIVEKAGDQWIHHRPLPCSGAFQLLDWRLNDRIRLERNSHYWDHENIRLKRIDLLHTDSANTALNLYLSGGADAILDKALIPPSLLPDLLSRPDFPSFEFLASYFLRFNVTRPPFDRPKVRQAISMAIDKQYLIDRITRGGELPATSFTTPGCGGYQPPEGLSFDVSAARKLMEEAGFPMGRGFRSFTYLFNSGGGGGSRIHEQIAVELREMLSKHLGIHLELRPVEWRTFLSDQRQLNYDLSRGSWVGDYPYPNTFLDVFVGANGNNRTGWKNARYDAAIEKANQQVDVNLRFQALREAEIILIREDPPIVPLFRSSGAFACDRDQWDGIYPNLMDAHPLRALRKKPGVSSKRGEELQQISRR